MENIQLKVDSFLAKYINDDNVAGIVGHGSYFDKSFRPTSDIDLIVIVYQGEVRKWHYDYNGLIFEVKIQPLEGLKKMVANSHLKVTRQFADSYIVYEKNDELAPIQKAAQEKLKQPHPLALRQGYRTESARNAYSQRNRLYEIKDDKGMFEIGCSALLMELAELFLLVKGVWGHRGIRKVKVDIEMVDQSVAQLFENSMAHNDIESRLEAINTLTNLVIDLLDKDLQKNMVLAVSE
ncbi:nucleotidyltransferase domain-containing protein [Pseudoalteromonas sp. MMG006]|uniref:nucleotidyltransferase domain-containing protein n=1 Tax=Pseudoalteromonas sp. MMG006 TaxID=2822683 RepID=UPI001B39BB39|nr:nucleotidyltransferase domain-containing protein [Pseudoalteromonas sp. MMG006]MBQ4800951.1 nucleotidyltransferase domain-containing protein [Pseudoalteromonas sp. MMG006]